MPDQAPDRRHPSDLTDAEWLLLDRSSPGGATWDDR